MKLRKNEMKLRKKQIKVPKNCFAPRWRIRKPYRGIFDFLDSDFDEAILYHETIDFCNSLIMRHPCLATRADRSAAPAELTLRIVDGGKLSGCDTLYRHAADQLIAP